nr:hypothetical protein [Tanacetum cinerariifolium]
LGMNVGGEEGQDAEDDDEELYRDVNINLEGRDSLSVSSQFATSMLNPSPDAGIDSLFESAPQVDVQASTTVAPLTLTAPTLPPPTIPTISQLDGAVSSIPDIVERYKDQRINEAVKVAVQIQFDRLRDEAQAENEEFLNKLDENIQKIIKKQVKEQVKVRVSKILSKIEKTVNEQLEAEVLTRSSNSSKTSYTMAADLSEMELKKILIKKMESNKSIHQSDEQRNLYKALVDAYECDKIILNTYEDTVTLKRHRDDADKDEEPSAGSVQGSKRRRERKESESTSAVDDQPIAEASQHPEWFQKQKKPLTPDPAWNKTLPATHGSIQPWISDLAKQADSRSSFNELMDTHVDFSTFLMNRLKVDTLTPELLDGPTYKLMKGSCKSFVKLEFFLEEVYKETIDQLDWNNPEGQQYPHNLLKPLPLIPNSQGRPVIPFDHFINNDLEYLRGGASSRSLLTMSTQKVESSQSPNFRSSNGIITSIWIGSLCIEMMTSYTSSKKVSKATKRSSTSKKSDTYRSDLKRKEAYIAYSNPRGFIYQNKDKQNRLMQIDELHKFSDGTLNDVRTALDDRLKGIRMNICLRLSREKVTRKEQQQ